MIKAAASGAGWRIWQTLADRCLINGTAGHDDDRLASLGRAIRGRNTAATETPPAPADTHDL